MKITAKQVGAIVTPAVKQICEQLRRRGFKTWLVGGCLRDFFLKKPILEYDFATEACPDEVTEIFSETIDIGREFGSMGIKLNGQVYEITTLRKESSYEDSRHPNQVRFTKDLEQDIARRDFTINSLAFDPLRLELYDYFHGLDDLHAGILRTVGDPATRFKEDGLRLLRACRFLAQMALQLAPETDYALQTEAANLKAISDERITREFLKLIAGPYVDISLNKLNDAGLLVYVSPALANLPEEDWQQLLDLIPNSQAEDRLLFVVSYLRASRLAYKFLAPFTISKKQKEHLLALAKHFPFHYEPQLTDSALRYYFRDLTTKDLDLSLRCIARVYRNLYPQEGARKHNLFEKRLLKLMPTFVPKDRIALSGDDILQLGVKASAKVGQIKDKLWDVVTEYPDKNHWSELIKYAKQMV